MMYNRIILNVGISLFLIIGFSVKAQTITEEQVTVIAPYSPIISKAQKINDFPAIEEQKVSKLKLDYTTSPQLMNTPFTLEDLKAAPYQSVSSSTNKQNYLAAGFGLYTTPYAELFLNTKLKRNYAVGIHSSYLSSQATVNNYAYSGFNKNFVEVWAKKTEADFKIGIGGFYQRDLFHYYGFKPEDIRVSIFSATPDFTAISEQIFSDAGFKFNYQNTGNTNNESHRLYGTYRYFWDKYNNKENNIFLDGNFQKSIHFLGIKNEFAGIGLETEVVLTNWEAETQLSNASSMGLPPNSPEQFFHGKTALSLNYSIQTERINFKAGGIVAFGLDSTSTLKIYPDFLLNVNIVPKILDFYVQFKGELESPSYYNLTRENPFVSAFLPLEYSSSTNRIKAGLNANIVDKVDLILWGSTEHITNALFFTTDTSGFYKNQFNLVYDDVDLIQIGGEVNARVDNLFIGMQLLYQKYTMTNESEAWYKPTMSARLNAEYWLFDNFKLSASLKTQSKVWAKEGSITHELDPWVQLNLGANYHFNKSLSAFIKWNSIFSKDYQLWYNYPVKELGAMLGASYSF